MALRWFNHLTGDRAIAWSGGSESVLGISTWGARSHSGIIRKQKVMQARLGVLAWQDSARADR